MNFNVLYPNQEVELTFYLDRTHQFPSDNPVFGMILKNRMTGEEIVFDPYNLKLGGRKVRLAFEITNVENQADPQIGVIYIDQDGYWDYELYYGTQAPFVDLLGSIYPVEKGSIFFYRSQTNPVYVGPSQQPEVIYISPDSSYNTNENFTASVLNTNPTN